MRTSLVLVWLAVLGCPGDDTDDSGVDTDCGASEWWPDADHDGYGGVTGSVVACVAPGGFVAATGDCDDSDELENPDAVESCDGDDDDCDGETDEADAIDPATWYVDADDDGFGVDGENVLGCDEPEGYAASAGDCAPEDPAIHPGADDVCDSVNNDCTGEADDDPTLWPSWYTDYDEDGYGLDETAYAACEGLEHHVSQGGDCDDEAGLVNPGAEEVCDDTEVDEDCDGGADEADPDDALEC